MNGSPEHGDAPAASSTSSAAPSPETATPPSPAVPPAAATPAPAAPASPSAPAAPAAGALAGAAPAAQSPSGSAPTAQASADATLAGQSPSGTAPAGQSPAGSAPAGQWPAGAAPAAQAQVPPPPPVSGPPYPPPAGQPVPPGMQGAMPRLQRKSPFLAGLLSLMPGIGQIYVGYYALGFIHIAVFAMTIALLASGPYPFASPFSPIRLFYPALSIFLGFFVIYNIVDAVQRATLYNLAIDGVQGIKLPDMNASLPKIRVSEGGGVALIAFGLLLLSNTLFGLPLYWLASWWPMGLVVLGVYLVVKARQER